MAGGNAGVTKWGRVILGLVWRLIVKSLCPRALMSISNIEVNKGQRFKQNGGANPD